MSFQSDDLLDDSSDRQEFDPKSNLSATVADNLIPSGWFWMESVGEAGWWSGEGGGFVRVDCVFKS